MNGDSLHCYYCEVIDKKKTHAMITCHDKRGCKHVCFEHARWRMTTSWAFGHSSDCPMSKKEQGHEHRTSKV